MVLMEIKEVLSSKSQSLYPEVVLKEVEGNNYLHIVIGRFEAAAISMAHNKRQPTRPISYDLAHQILAHVDARVVRVEITDFNLRERTYYAEIHLVDDEGKTHTLDARPSDAIALALRFRAPIYAAVKILKEEGRVRSDDDEWVPAEVEALVKPVAAPQGDHPIIAPSAVNQLEQLKRRMRQAVAEEIYEEAARLRDEISRLNRDD
ncbi:MAG: bifunctional nuclease family protein [Gemmatimonadota bacterium]|nr:bifunctional nuclease family protein [Gemmatimonadota bacterium]